MFCTTCKHELLKNSKQSASQEKKKHTTLSLQEGEGKKEAIASIVLNTYNIRAWAHLKSLDVKKEMEVALST